MGGGGGGYESGGRPVWDGAVKKCRGGGGVWEVQGKRGKEEEGRGGRVLMPKKERGKGAKTRLGSLVKVAVRGCTYVGYVGRGERRLVEKEGTDSLLRPDKN